MEDQTGFDLNAAIESWRQEMAEQRNLTSEDRRELEAHLRDTIAELRDRGLNEEESFRLARHRMGSPSRLAVEFIKADPARIWRQRIFWGAIALLLLGISEQTGSIFWNMAMSFASVERIQTWSWSITISILSLLFFHNLPLIGCAVLLANGRLTKKNTRIQSICNSRFCFIFTASITFLSVCLLNAATGLHLMHHLNPAVRSSSGLINIGAFLSPAVWNFTLIGLIAWLMPRPPSKTPGPA